MQSQRQQTAAVTAQSPKYKEICDIYAKGFIKCLSPDEK